MGSFLGASLVTALLLIVPLYEASLSAIDLSFTFLQAPSAQVDMRARTQLVPHDPDAAQSNRDLVAGRRERVGAWYPSAQERIQSADIRFIPVDIPFDRLAEAEAWKASALAWADEVERLAGPLSLTGTDLAAQVAAEGLTEELQKAADAGVELPDLAPTPYPQVAPEATVSVLITSPGIADRVEVIAGDWPEEQDHGVLSVALGENVARLLGLDPGDQTIIRPFGGFPFAFEVVDVAAIARPIDETEALWRGIAPGDAVLVTQEAYDHWAALVPTSPDADPWLRTNRGMGPISSAQVWSLPLDRDSVVLEELDAFETGVAGFRTNLGRNGISVTTAIPDLIESFDVRTVIFGGPILAMLALVVGGALYFLIYTAALTAEREGPELALLRTRGASRIQTIGIHLGQSALVAAAAALVAPFAARLLVGLTGYIPPMSDLTAGRALEISQTRSLVPFAVVGALVAFLSMGTAILPTARRSVLELRLLTARPTQSSVWQRYYIDIFLVILAAILLFELRQRGIVDVGPDPGLDPFVVISPMLFLLAGGLVLLRLLPYLMRGLGWLLTKSRGLIAALPGWHLGRNPVPYGRLALLIWLTTGFGAFALTYAQTLDDSYRDRAGFAAGSGVRLVGEGAGLVDVPDGLDGTAVLRDRGLPRLASRPAELLAIRPHEFADVVAWRDDFGPSPAEVFGDLRRDPVEIGVELPAGTVGIAFDAVAVPSSWADQAAAQSAGEEPAQPLQLLAQVVDARGRTATFPSAPIQDSAWTTSGIDFDLSGALDAEPPERLEQPLTLTALWAERPTDVDNPSPNSDEVLLFDSFAARTVGGSMPIDDAIATVMTANAGLELERVPGNTAASAYFAEVPEGERPVAPATIAASPLHRNTDVTAWQLPFRSRLDPVPYLGRPVESINVLLDRESSASAALSVGETARFQLLGVQVDGEMVGRIERLPTATSPTDTGAMVVDLDVLLHAVNGEPTWAYAAPGPRSVSPNELWIDADDPDDAVRRLAVRDTDDIVTAKGVEASFASRPVQVGLVSILLVGAATSVLLALAGVAGYVLVAVRRRASEMGVLRAIGFARRGVAGTFALEQLVVLVLGAAMGIAAGVGLMRLLLPFLQLGEEGGDIVPPALLAFNPGVLGAYLAVVAVLLGVAVLWSTRHVSVRELSEVLREGDR